MKNLLASFFLLSLIISAFILRFYKLEEWFFFNIDEDWFFYIVRKIVVLHKPALIGWEMPGGLLTIPVAYYLGAFLMFFTNNNPLSLAINAALISIAAVIGIYFTANKIFKSKFIAIFASIFFTFSYFVIIYSRVTLSLYLGPFLSILTYYALAKIVKDRKFVWFYPLALVFIFATQEGSLFSLILLSLFFIIKYRKKINFGKLHYPILIIIFSLTPLVVFDLRHDYLASKRIINLFSFAGKNHSLENNIESITGVLQLFGSSIPRTYFISGRADLNAQILPCPKYLVEKDNQTPFLYPYIGTLIIFLFFYFVIKNKKRTIGEELISTHILIIIIGMLLYSFILPSHQHEWFFVLLTPAYVFVGGYLLDKLLRQNKIYLKIIIVLFISFFIYDNFKNIERSTAIGYRTKHLVSLYIKRELANTVFDVDVLGDKCNGYGYRYLLTHEDIEPNYSYMDGSYSGWLYPKKTYQKSSYQVYIVPQEDLLTPEDIAKYNYLLKKSLKRSTINLVEVLIIPNSSEL